ncbi:protein-tyrosine phosphatase family protein [Roseococcus pinisoli]|uniref:Tyrosine specific protein phosphatases domain-containing protein n=1 Tax=Roseococcus pinisoli TaxID=2835040 RepID=A0ABS5QF88_9PROT|nr:hypothetical protein [Roseococcus pinisoli]MBS7812367.1 hypothetical protein [Roseococcus pinisoli]
MSKASKKGHKPGDEQGNLLDTAYDYVGDDSPWYDTAPTGNQTVSSQSSSKTYRACYEDHPPLTFPDGRKIWGGSCTHPVIKDADVYIGLDSGMKATNRSLPWEPGDEVYFPIQDMQIPINLSSFTKMVDWTYAQLQAGRKVHVGCIGGHGRTGMLLAALAGRCYKIDDPIAFVRKNYCKKAVETTGQIEFLVKHFGAKAASATKTTQTFSKGATGNSGWPVGKGGKGGKSPPTASGTSFGSVNPVVNSKTYVFGMKAWQGTK